MARRFPTCCCFTCSLNPLTFNAYHDGIGWTPTADGGVCVFPGFNTTMHVAFARHCHYGFEISYSYDVDGILGMPHGTLDSSTGYLTTATGIVIPDQPSSGTVLIRSSMGDRLQYDEDN